MAEGTGAGSPESNPGPRRARRLAALSPGALIRALLKNYFLAIAVAAGVASLLRLFVVEAYRIPTDFMAPQLLPGDHIFVNKLSKAPRRGDVVVFNLPNEPRKDYIKRVVALGGDVVEIRDGELILNGKSVDRAAATAGYFEEEIEGRRFGVIWKDAPREERKMMPLAVPAGQVFVLGDNRSNRLDSRSWGFLPDDAIKGKAALIWFSVGGRPAGKEEGGAWHVRWQRVLTKVR